MLERHVIYTVSIQKDLQLHDKQLYSDLKYAMIFRNFIADELLDEGYVVFYKDVSHL